MAKLIHYSRQSDQSLSDMVCFCARVSNPEHQQQGLNNAKLIQYLKDKGIQTVFHYLSLHKSAYYESKHDGRELPLSDYYTDTLLRLPLYYELSTEEVEKICFAIQAFFENQLRYDTMTRDLKYLPTIGLRSQLWNDYRNY